MCGTEIQDYDLLIKIKLQEHTKFQQFSYLFT